MGYDPTQAGSGAWLTEDGTTTGDPDRARLCETAADAGRWAVELTDQRHLALLWAPYPERERDLDDLQSQQRRAWQSRVAAGPPADW